MTMAQVLIVEDDPDIASLLRRGLAASGYGAEWAETVEAAMARVEAGGIDAAIIDMMLGADNGAELLAELRRRGHRMPALMLSALARVEDRAVPLTPVSGPGQVPHRITPTAGRCTARPGC